MVKLRKEAKAQKVAAYKQVQMLAQALSPVVSFDVFLPQAKRPESDPPIDALTKLPCLVCVCDEERKQTLVGKM